MKTKLRNYLSVDDFWGSFGIDIIYDNNLATVISLQTRDNKDFFTLFLNDGSIKEVLVTDCYHPY